MKFFNQLYYCISMLALTVTLIDAGAAEETPYQQLKALFQSGTPLTLEQIPANGVLKVHGVDSTSLATTEMRFVFSKRAVPSGETIRISFVANSRLSDEEAVAHLSGCGSMIPPASPTLEPEALASWTSLASARPINLTDFTAYKLAVNLWRTARLPGSGRVVIVTRRDYREPGFSYERANKYYGRKQISEEWYGASDESTIQPVNPSNTVRPSCDQLHTPRVWQVVTGPWQSQVFQVRTSGRTPETAVNWWYQLAYGRCLALGGYNDYFYSNLVVTPRPRNFDIVGDATCVYVNAP